ncbi:tRNA (adenosine(37)-N6)-dimethylallyltransferase MiaA [Albibacterium indicum]|uniref:tRNA (adenosine(37)-N6)-dimethylallyltransferase MiaA n=1 Tax=Albibacterium indicum TaxID=2292082 RepID=UPI00197EF613|nr:tRNA (adenosine(37)-N6)-dimethylallyltransferase MiaA [Pedobacter indicus]
MVYKDFELITILGPTASGKTSLAVALAKEIDGEIISADSRQIYRGMDIGTGKDLSEYGDISYHLIDILNAGEIYGVGQFQKDFNRAFEDIKSREKIPILCGGTGLYIQSVLQNFEFTSVPRNPELREAIEGKTIDELRKDFRNMPLHDSFDADTSTHKRLVRAIEIAKWLESNRLEKNVAKPPKSLTFGIQPALDVRRANISARLKSRFDGGLIDEVEQLMKKGVSEEMLIFYGLEYKFITQYLQGMFDYETCFQRLEIAIHQFAKRQMTYFRKMEKDGLAIHWLTEDGLEERLAYIKAFFPAKFVP